MNTTQLRKYKYLYIYVRPHAGPIISKPNGIDTNQYNLFYRIYQNIEP